jgi:hypothetical protein
VTTAAPTTTTSTTAPTTTSSGVSTGLALEVPNVLVGVL